MNADLNDLNIVLGCKTEVIAPIMETEKGLIINEQWEQGMGTSISCGVAKTREHADGLLISLVDQYQTTTALINNLISAFRKESNKLIISRYGNGILGPPAIFPPRLYDELSDLDGDRGAGKIIKSELSNNPERVIVIDFENGHLDIDTPEDLLNLPE